MVTKQMAIGVRAAILSMIVQAMENLGKDNWTTIDDKTLEILSTNNTTVNLRYTEPGKAPQFFTITVRENIVDEA